MAPVWLALDIVFLARSAMRVTNNKLKSRAEWRVGNAACGLPPPLPSRAFNAEGKVVKVKGYAVAKDLSEPGQLTLHLDCIPDIFAAPYWIVALGDEDGVSFVHRTATAVVSWSGSFPTFSTFGWTVVLLPSRSVAGWKHRTTDQ